jgi:hypothetical protein
MAHEAALKLVADLKAQLPPAEAEAAKLADARDEHLLGYLAGEPDAVAAYEAADALATAAEEKAEIIRRGIKRAEAEAKAAQARRIAAENADRIGRLAKAFDAKSAHAEKVTKWVEEGKVLFDQWQDIDQKAIHAWPGLALPSDGWGLMLGPSAVTRAFGQEIWRICRDESGLSSKPIFPGPISGRSELTGSVGKAGVTDQMQFPNLKARVEDARQLALDVLEGRRNDFGKIGLTVPNTDEKE